MKVTKIKTFAAYSKCLGWVVEKPSQPRAGWPSGCVDLDFHYASRALKINNRRTLSTKRFLATYVGNTRRFQARVEGKRGIFTNTALGIAA